MAFCKHKNSLNLKKAICHLDIETENNYVNLNINKIGLKMVKAFHSGQAAINNH